MGEVKHAILYSSPPPFPSDWLNASGRRAQPSRLPKHRWQQGSSSWSGHRERLRNCGSR